MKRGQPAVILVPTDHISLVLDADGWHMRAVPPQWWLDEREARHEMDLDTTRQHVAPDRLGAREPSA